MVICGFGIHILIILKYMPHFWYSRSADLVTRDYQGLAGDEQISTESLQDGMALSLWPEWYQGDTIFDSEQVALLCNLRVFLDSEFLFEKQAAALSRNIANIATHALVTSHLNYWNATWGWLWSILEATADAEHSGPSSDRYIFLCDHTTLEVVLITKRNPGAELVLVGSRSYYLKDHLFPY